MAYINSHRFNPDVGTNKLDAGKTMQFSQDLKLTNLGNNWYCMVENHAQGANTVHDALHEQMFLFNTETRLVAQAFESEHSVSFDQISAQWLYQETAAEQKDWFQ